QINSSAIAVGAIAVDAYFRYADLLVVFHSTAAGSRRAAGHVDSDEFVVMHFVVAHGDVGNGEVRQAAINLNAYVFVVGDEVGVYDRASSSFQVDAVARAIHCDAVANLEMARRRPLSGRSDRPDIRAKRVRRRVGARDSNVSNCDVAFATEIDGTQTSTSFDA